MPASVERVLAHQNSWSERHQGGRTPLSCLDIVDALKLEQRGSGVGVPLRSSSEGERQYANSVRTNLAALVADVLALDVKAVGLVVGRHGEFFGRPRGDEGDVWVGVDAVVSTEKSSLPKRKTNCFMSSGAFSLTSATPATAGQAVAQLLCLLVV